MEQEQTNNQVKTMLGDAQHILIIQADNPDGDSLASALALEQILGDLGKEPYLYCGVDIPGYLRYLPGWDRVGKDIPKEFDVSIIVDTSAIDLLGNLERSGQKGWVANKPCVVIDHHAVENSIYFASVVLNRPVVATGEIIYELAKEYEWPLNTVAMEMLGTAILADSLGLTSEATTARSIHIIAELVEEGLSIAALEDRRRSLMRKSPELVAYKGRLLQRVEYHYGARIATITIPWEEIKEYSPLYNPTMLVIDDMRFTEGTDVAIGFKVYNDGKITAKIRCNYGKAIAGKLAEHFGGGGHAYASGFKITDGRPFSEIKVECLTKANELLDKLSDYHETL